MQICKSLLVPFCDREPLLADNSRNDGGFVGEPAGEADNR